jgi:DNA polymerase delta subunit 1
MKIFGVTPNQNSIMCHVHGFRPYMYIPCPNGMNECDLPSLIDFFASRNQYPDAEIVRKRSIYGYSNDTDRTFIKLTVNSPTELNAVRSITESGFAFGSFVAQSYPAFESNMPIVLRFMVDAKITGMNWLELPPGNYSIRDEFKRISKCQIEADVQ